jgi:hypothetical protein|tara:strand:- start:203 stop:394 length:192 start_codon:yes stop_codon:yes gene_type:complete
MESRVDQDIVENYRRQIEERERASLESRKERKADDTDRGTFNLIDADGNLIPHKDLSIESNTK